MDEPGIGYVVDATPETTQQLVQKWAALKKIKDAHEAQIDLLRGEIEQIKDLLFKRMEADGVINYKLPEGTVYLHPTAYPKMLRPEEEIIKWFDEMGHPEVAPRKVSRTRIKDYIEIAMADDLPLPPPELIDMKPAKQVKLRSK